MKKANISVLAMSLTMALLSCAPGTSPNANQPNTPTASNKPSSSPTGNQTNSPTTAPSNPTGTPTLSPVRRSDFYQGPISRSDSSYNWAIDGEGYFKVIDRGSGKVYFTRRGVFKRDGNGQIVTVDGNYALEPAISTATDQTLSFVGEGGSVYILDAKDNFVQLANLAIFRFVKPDALKKLGGKAELFEATAESGEAISGQPKSGGYGFVLSSASEDFGATKTLVPDMGCKNIQIAKQQSTKRVLDWSIEGAGYFAFLDPFSGETYYSRHASLEMNSNRQLVSKHGYLLEPTVTLPEGEFVQKIDPDGSIWISKSSQLKPRKFTSIQIAKVSNLNAMQVLGFSRPTMHRLNGIKAEMVTPGQNDTGKVRGEYLERCFEDLVSVPAKAYDVLPSFY